MHKQNVDLSNFKSYQPDPNKEPWRFMAMDFSEWQNFPNSEKISVKKDFSLVNGKLTAELNTSSPELPKDSYSIYANDYISSHAIFHADKGYEINDKTFSNEISEYHLKLRLKNKHEAVSSKITIPVGKNAEIIEVVDGDSSAGFYSGYTRIEVQKDAKLNFIQIYSLPKQINSIQKVEFELAENAEVNHYLIFVGAMNSLAENVFKVLGKNANIKSTVAVRGIGSQNFNIRTSLDHNAPKSTSEQICYFVLDDHSRANFDGTIRISKEANQTDAFLKHKSMLLSPKAQVNSMPKLEISTDDVKCAHGSSVSSVDPEQVFYLQSRGIEANTAKKLIIDGFLEPAFLAISSESLRDEIRQKIYEAIYEGEK